MKTLKNISIIMLTVIIILIAANVTNAQSKSSSSDKYFIGCAMNVTMVNQNPYPAQPDSYVDVVFQVSWLQNYVCNGSRFELVTDYPFSLDSQSAARLLPDDTYIQDYKKDWMVPYKLRVDKDALDGDNEIEVKYSPGIWPNETPMTQKFNIKIEDARTDFDAVLQDITGSDVSIAIANSGKYTANSVVVRIPEQENFVVDGTDGQMVGNLESGDYTVVGFTITQKEFAGSNFSKNSNFSRTQQMPQNPSQKTLKFDIYYTDNIGERRVVNMELPFKTNSGNQTAAFSRGNFQGTRSATTGTASSSSSGTLLIGAIAFIVIVSIVYLIIRRRSKKKGKSNEKGETPDWMKNAKAKEKK